MIGKLPIGRRKLMSTSNHETKTAFWAMVSQDLLVQWRDHNEFIFRVAMLPLILIVVYGFMLPTVGLCLRNFRPICSAV